MDFYNTLNLAVLVETVQTPVGFPRWTQFFSRPCVFLGDRLIFSETGQGHTNIGNSFGLCRFPEKSEQSLRQVQLFCARKTLRPPEKRTSVQEPS